MPHHCSLPGCAVKQDGDAHWAPPSSSASSTHKRERKVTSEVTQAPEAVWSYVGNVFLLLGKTLGYQAAFSSLQEQI